MQEKNLIVEDQFVEADYLRMMLKKSDYLVTGIAHSVAQAKELIKQERPDIVLLANTTYSVFRLFTGLASAALIA